MKATRSLWSTALQIGIALSFVTMVPNDAHAIPRTLRVQEKACIVHLLENISPRGAAEGAIVASPWQHYFFHWVRDGALVSRVFVKMWWKSLDQEERDIYLTEIRRILAFAKKLQSTPNKSDPWLGEPKFHADGRAIDEEWGRPQSDGPALQSITYTIFLHFLEVLGEHQVLQQELYDGKHPSVSVIRAANEYVYNEWKKPSFDVWEEYMGLHFYNLKVQRAALMAGAWLADKYHETETAQRYRTAAQEIREILDTKFWDAERGVLIPTIEPARESDFKFNEKKKGIDSVVILGVNHSFLDFLEDDLYGPTDEKVLSTLVVQEAEFAGMYNVNKKGFPGTAIGRYPGDTYDGYATTSEGNPWVLTTAGFGEAYFRAASRWIDTGKIEVTAISQKFFKRLLGYEVAVQTIDRSSPLYLDVLRACYKKGEAFLERTVMHGLPGGHFSEQIKREHGDMTGASDLTWSYAAFLSAYWEFQALSEKLLPLLPATEAAALDGVSFGESALYVPMQAR